MSNICSKYSETLGKYFKENLANSNLAETFDLTGKSNPQYRRYSDWGKFLKHKYGGKEVTDPQGNSWVEIDLKPEYKRMPVEAFGIVPIGMLRREWTKKEEEK